MDSNPRTIHLITLLLVLALTGLPSAPVQGQELQRHEFESPHMGTLFRIVLYAPGDSIARAASDSAFEKIEMLNDIMSDYKQDSELNKLSACSGTNEFINVSPPLFEVLSKAQIVAEQTNGTFDITVGPYVKLWRAMRRMKKPDLLNKKNLDEASKSIGYQYVKLNKSDQSVALKKTGMQLDLGGIAKGYAADEALRVLHEFDIYSALIDAGGDITLGDAPPGKKGWRVSIPVHNLQGEKEFMTLILANQAVATSGDLFQYIEIDGKRYSHIIDPRTGLGLTDQSTVTVIAPDGITADSYASAVSVMGPSDGIKFIESKPGIAMRIEYKENEKINVRVSSGFNQYIDPKNKK